MSREVTVRDTSADETFDATVEESHEHRGGEYARVEEIDGGRSGWVEL